MTTYQRTPVLPIVPPNSRQRDNSWIMSWPRSSFLELGPYETAPGSARGHIRNVLPDWGLGQHRESAELIATELLTNSINAVRAVAWAQPPAVRLWLLGASPQVMVLVWDPLGTAPQPGTPGDYDENGRGLLIISRCSTRCGYYHPPEQYAPEYHGGKVTWATLGTSDNERD